MDSRPRRNGRSYLKRRRSAELRGHVDLQSAADLNGLLRGLRCVVSALRSPLNTAVSAPVFLDSDLNATALVYTLILKDGRRSSLIQVDHADEQVPQVGIVQPDDNHGFPPPLLPTARAQLQSNRPRARSLTIFGSSHGLGTKACANRVIRQASVSGKFAGFEGSNCAAQSWIAWAAAA